MTKRTTSVREKSPKDTIQMIPEVDRKLRTGCIPKLRAMVPFLCSTFMCINTYAQQPIIDVNHSLKDPSNSAVTMTRSYLSEQRDVFDILKMLFSIDITSLDTVSKRKGKAIYSSASWRRLFVEHRICSYNRVKCRNIYR